MTDLLIEDPVINNQTWAVVSLITPKSVKNCNKFLLKVKGIYSSHQRANDEAIKFHKKEKDFPVFTIEVGKWIPYSDSSKEKHVLLDELNELMKLYLDERKEANDSHERRTTNYDDTTYISQEKEEKQELLKSDEVMNEGGKKIEYLKEDDPTDQKYYCISFLTSDQLEKENNLEIRGFKVRGMYNSEEEAKERCKNLYNVESTINTYVGNIGHWVAWEDNSDNAEDFEYANNDLNNLMKAHKENQEKVKMFNATESQVLENKNEDDKNDLLSELVEDSLENVNLNDELKKAKEKYENLLKDEKL